MRTGFVSLAAGFALLAVPGPGWAAEEKGTPAARPAPAKALAAAAKALAKAESYRTKVDIEGGLSDREDHKVTERNVGESYEGEVFGPLMHIPEASRTQKGVQAFRQAPAKGAVFIQGTWKNIVSDPASNRMNRLFTFPEEILRRALANAASAAWLDPPAEAGAGEPATKEAPEEGDRGAKGDPAEAKKAPKDDAKGSRPGKTTVVRKGSSASPAPAKPEGPWIVRVETPFKEALQHFTEVQNSGCFGGG